jgi:hypothetical protein
MKQSVNLLWSTLALLGIINSVNAADLVQAKDGSGVYGYKDTPVLPWCQWKVHDPDRPALSRINPGPAQTPVPAPSDAVILFNGKDLSAWNNTDSKLEDGCIVSGNGSFQSKQHFGDCQIHIEWMGPAHFDGPWYNKGNNGVLLMGVYEIQIFDSYNEKIYPDGQTASIYGQTPPLVNASRPPGQWQTFDIIFFAPKFEGGKLIRAPRVTVFHNGMLAQHNEEIHGEVAHRQIPVFTRKTNTGPLAFGGHGCPVRFRNIWVRPL